MKTLRTIRPLHDGVIADFYACEQMIRGLIKMVNNRPTVCSLLRSRMVIGVPSVVLKWAACRARLCRACRWTTST